MNKKIILWIIVLLITIQLVASLGIRPARTTLIFEEGRDYSNEFWVVNNEGREFIVNIYTEGEMGEYITLKKKTLTFREDDDAQVVEFEVHLPEEVPPGESVGNIIVEEKLISVDPKVISSKVLLKYKVVVQGAYPDKYVLAKLNFQDMGNTIKFVSELENVGKKDISSVHTTFYVNDKKQEQQVITTEITSLAKKENKLLVKEVDRDLFELGEFEVSAVTKYDDQTLEISKKLLIGTPEVDITYFDKYFIANKINEYAMELLNKWNRKVENVYVDVTVKKDEKKIDEFRTKSVDIEGEMRKRINDYFDARGKKEGKYVFGMVVHFWNTYQMEEKSYEIELLNEEDFKDISQGNAIAGKATGFGGGIWWAILGLFAVTIIVVGAYIGYRYKNKDDFE